MNVIEFRERDVETNELEPVGRVDIDTGEIEPMGDNDPEALKMEAEDVKRLSVEEILSLYNGPNLIAFDMRDPDEIPEAERERMMEEEAKSDLAALATDIGLATDADAVMRLLSSHANPYPTEKVLEAVREERDLNWIAQMDETCETDAERRRYIARSDAAEDVLERLMTDTDVTDE